MHETFLHFQDSAQKLGLLQSNPELSQQFRFFVEKFKDLKKEANDAVLECSENEDDRSPRNLPERPVHANKTSQSSPLQTTTPPNVENVGLGWGHAVTAETTQNTNPQSQQFQPDGFLLQVSCSSSHSQHLDNETDNIHQPPTPIQAEFDQIMPARTSYYHHHHQQQQQPLPFGFIVPDGDQSPQFSFTVPASIPTPDLSPPTTRVGSPPMCVLPDIMATRGLPSITTFSYEETSFARRLVRATVESGYRLLCQPHTRRRSLDSVFRLSLPFITVDSLIKKFKWLVSRDINEEFDWWDTPFIHLGGAGTHYPRRDPQGNIITMKNSWTVQSWTVRRTGPFERHMMRLESVADGRWQDIGGVDFRDFEGEWFDAHDVQGYLEDRWACKIDPRSSFAQCLVSEEDLAPLLQMSEHDSNSSSLDHRPVPCYGLDVSSFHHPSTTSFPRATDVSRPDMAELPFDQALGLDLASGSSLGFPGNTGFDMGLDLDMGGVGQASGTTVVRQRRSKTAWVDVTKLIHGKPGHNNSQVRVELMLDIAGIIQHSYCLGRAPGFRREKIDSAVRGALVAPY